MDNEKFQRTVLAALTAAASVGAQNSAALSRLENKFNRFDAVDPHTTGSSAPWISAPDAIGRVRIAEFDGQPPAVLELLAQANEKGPVKLGPLFYVPLVLVAAIYPDLSEEQKMRISMNAGSTPGTDQNVGRWAYAFPNAPKSWEYGDHLDGVTCFNANTEATQEKVLAVLRELLTRYVTDNADPNDPRFVSVPK